MQITEIKQIIKRELPAIIKRDNKMRDWVLDIGKTHFPDKKETDSNFDRILKEIQQHRIEQNKKWKEHNEEQTKKWEEQNKKWWEHNKKQDKKWEEQEKKWEEQNKKWWEHNKKQDKKWEEQNKKWWEHNKKQDKKWEEQEKKWWENQEKIDKKFKLIESANKKFESTMGAIGARWGINTEASFRNAIKGMLDPHFNFEVLNIQDYDEEGDVFGHPEQIELDIAIFNKTTYLIEIKSSMSKADMYIFYKKAKFYIKKYKTKNTKLIVISPMIDDKAKKMAKKLNITAYSHTSDVEKNFK